MGFLSKVTDIDSMSLDRRSASLCRSLRCAVGSTALSEDASTKSILHGKHVEASPCRMFTLGGCHATQIGHCSNRVPLIGTTLGREMWDAVRRMRG